MSDLSLDGKRVFVTGGSGDIGRALCRAFSSRGAQVAFSYFSSHDGKDRTLTAIAEAGASEGLAFRANLRDDRAADELADEVIGALEHVDIFVNNAATGVLRPTLELTRKHWDWTLNTNARAFLLLANRFAPSMPTGGRIMALTSFGARRALEHYAAIGASKAAMESLVRHLAMELGPKGITVNAICPGVVDTQALAHFPNREQLLDVSRYRTPSGRIATPDDVADVAVLLSSRLAAMVQGQTIVVDGGYSILA